MMEGNRHYIRVNEQLIIIHAFSDAFEQPLDTDICVAENAGRHYHLDLFTNDMYYKYKYENQEIVERSREEIEASDEFRTRRHLEMKAQCEADIAALGETKAHSIAAKKQMSMELTTEEEQYLVDFLNARDARLAKYEEDKLACGIITD